MGRWGHSGERGLDSNKTGTPQTPKTMDAAACFRRQPDVDTHRRRREIHRKFPAPSSLEAKIHFLGRGVLREPKPPVSTRRAPQAVHPALWYLRLPLFWPPGAANPPLPKPLAPNPLYKIPPAPPFSPPSSSIHLPHNTTSPSISQQLRLILRCSSSIAT